MNIRFVAVCCNSLCRSALSYLSVHHLVKDNSRRQGGKLTVGVERGPAVKSAFSRRADVSSSLLFSFSLICTDRTFPQRSLVNVNLSDLCSVSPSVSLPSLLICTNHPPQKNPCTLKPFSRRLMYDLFEIDSPTRSWFVDECVCDQPVWDFT